MLVVANRLPVAEGHEDRFLQLFEERLDQIRARSGLREVEILRSVDTDEFVINAYWESREAFEQWRNSEDFETAHADLPTEMFTGPNRLDVYELELSFRTGRNSH
jgi:heme-degrading monooxygenase HmoA